MQAMNGPTFATSTAPTPVSRPAPARGGTAGRLASVKPDADNPAARVFTYLRLHWLTILFCGALVGAGLAYAAWVILPPKYESYALFRVAQNPPSVSGGTNPNQSGRTEFTTYVKTSASLIQSEYVYAAAMRDDEDRKYRLADLPTIKQQKDPYRYFDEKLVVSSKEGSEIIRLSLQGDNPEDIRKIVDAIKDAYMKEVVGKEQEQRKKLRDDLVKAQIRLADLLRIKTGVTEPATALAGMPPIGSKVIQAGNDDKQPGNPIVPAVATSEKPAVGTNGDTERMKQQKFPRLSDQAINLEKSLGDQEIQIEVAQSNVIKLKKFMQEALDAPVPDDLTLAVKTGDADYKMATAKAAHLWNEFTQKQAEVRQPDSEGVRKAQKRAEAADVEAEQLLRKKVAELNEIRRKPRLDDLRNKIETAEDTVKLLNKQKEITLRRLTETKKELAEIPNPPETIREQQAREKKVSPENTNLETTDSAYAALTARVIAAELDANTPPRIVDIQSASTPVQKDSQKQILGTVFAGMMGFVLVGAVMVLLEMRTRKVSSLDELKMTMPVVGVVPWMPDAATARDPIKRADVNEAIDKLRAYVAQTWLSRGATTVTVTSPLGDEGKAFTAFGLASSLAQAGYKTLLVDFDLRNPALHPFAGVANTQGVCELLRGESDFRSTIQVLTNGLHFLPAGKWSDESRQAAVGGRLEALLTRLKEPFDCVVLHGHALLTTAESVEVARRSEVVLLCALYRDTRVPLLKKATESVNTMEIPYSGVVYLGATPTEALR
jgi:polysaccharide biosynthesis transport protein